MSFPSHEHFRRGHLSTQYDGNKVWRNNHPFGSRTDTREWTRPAHLKIAIPLNYTCCPRKILQHTMCVVDCLPWRICWNLLVIYWSSILIFWVFLLFLLFSCFFIDLWRRDFAVMCSSFAISVLFSSAFWTLVARSIFGCPLWVLFSHALFANLFRDKHRWGSQVLYSNVDSFC